MHQDDNLNVYHFRLGRVEHLHGWIATLQSSQERVQRLQINQELSWLQLYSSSTQSESVFLTVSEGATAACTKDDNAAPVTLKSPMRTAVRMQLSGSVLMVSMRTVQSFASKQLSGNGA